MQNEDGDDDDDEGLDHSKKLYGVRRDLNIISIVAFKSTAGVPLLASVSCHLALWDPSRGFLRTWKHPESDTVRVDEDMWKDPDLVPWTCSCIVAFAQAGAARLAHGFSNYRVAIYDPENDGPPLKIIC